MLVWVLDALALCYIATSGNVVGVGAAAADADVAVGCVGFKVHADCPAHPPRYTTATGGSVVDVGAAAANVGVAIDCVAKKAHADGHRPIHFHRHQ